MIGSCPDKIPDDTEVPAMGKAVAVYLIGLALGATGFCYCKANLVSRESD
jgi:hypothetical protein